MDINVHKNPFICHQAEGGSWSLSQWTTKVKQAWPENRWAGLTQTDTYRHTHTFNHTKKGKIWYLAETPCRFEENNTNSRGQIWHSIKRKKMTISLPGFFLHFIIEKCKLLNQKSYVSLLHFLCSHHSFTGQPVNKNHEWSSLYSRHACEPFHRSIKNKWGLPRFTNYSVSEFRLSSAVNHHSHSSV